jgi:type IV pilus assembly protein PilB
LDKSVSVPSLDELGIRGKNLNWVLEQIKKTHGVLLITGPTGSGKSTTLYSILSRINEAAVNIVTLEDPVEYFIEGVNQSQINPDVGLTFASGLRSILRQDPNVVMVGEIRDQETAELGVQAALTGHLVFSTLHTNNAVGAVPRLMDMGIEPFLLEASMNLVVAQRLVRKICQDCIEQVQLTPLTRKTIEDALKTVPDEYFDERVQKESFRMFKGKGCDKCGNTGYKGRMGIFEVLPMLVELEEMIFNKTPAFKIYEAANKFGVITMKQDGVVKVIRGETTLEEVLRVTTE